MTLVTAALVASGLAQPLAAQAATPVTDGASLQSAISSSGSYQLTQNIGQSPETPLTYDSTGTNVTIDLNGFTMESYYITVPAGDTITITDTSTSGGELDASGLGLYPAIVVPMTASLVLSGSARIRATGAPGQAGIGGSSNGLADAGSVTIKDHSDVLAVAGDSATNGAAGIGGAAQGNGGTVHVEDSATVVASGSVISNSTYSGGAGIGGGSNSYGGTITVSDSANVTTYGGLGAAGIGGGKGQGLNGFTISDSAVVESTPGPNPAGATTPADSIGNGANSNTINPLTLSGGSWTIPELAQQRIRQDTTSATTIINSGLLLNFPSTVVLTNNAAIQNPGGLGLVGLPVKNRNYSALLNTDGGTLADGVSYSVDFYARTLSLAAATLPIPTREGYSFTGWKFQNDPNGPSVVGSTNFTPFGTSADGSAVDVQLRASWQFIKLASTTSTVAVPAQLSYGSPAALSASVTNGATGPVSFSVDGGSPFAVAQAPAAAVELPANLSVGNHTVTASYSGDDTYLPSSGSTSVTVMTLASTTTASLSASNVVAGTTVSVTPTVSAGATGSITISIDGTAIGTTSSGQPMALPTTLGAGTHSVVAEYGGDATHNPSSATLTLTVTAAPAGSASPNTGAGSGTDTTETTTKTTPKITVTAKKFAKGTKPTITVTISKLTKGTKASGKVAVYVNKKKVKTVAFTQKTVVKITLKKKYSKAIAVKVKYLGSSTLAAATSKSVKVRVK